MKTQLTTQDYKTAIKVMEAYEQSCYNLYADLATLEAKVLAQSELDKWNSFTLEDCPDMKVFLSWAEETLDEELREDTPHGEYGGDIEGYFRWNDKEWLVTYAPDWNRHDKQYYFIDNWGDDHTTAVELVS